jgi:hypothetical protein
MKHESVRSPRNRLLWSGDDDHWVYAPRLYSVGGMK